MKAAIYIIILIGLGLVIYDAWFSESIMLDTAMVGLALMIFGVAGLVDYVARELRG